jgi:hypothetical protein
LRDRLLFEYQGEPACPSDVARRVGRPLNVVSYHTRVLADLGFLELVGTRARRGGTAHYYRSAIPQVIDGDAWVEIPVPVRRMMVRGVLATLTAEADAAGRGGGFDSAHAHLSHWPLALDEQAAGEVASLVRRVAAELERVQADADRRAGAPRQPFVVALMAFAAAAA